MAEGTGSPEGYNPPEQAPKFHDLISKEEVEDFRKKAQQAMGVDLSDVNVTLTRPGEELFDRQEIQFKLFTEKCQGDWEKFEQQYGFIDEVPINQLREAVKADGVTLDGTLPGFALTPDGSGEIIFFAVSDKNANEMASNYAKKSGQDVNFQDTKQSVDYLKGLSKEALAHEFAHIKYQRLMKEDSNPLHGFNVFVGRQPALQARVGVLQGDKYGGAANVPINVIREEAYADMMGSEVLKSVTGNPGTNRINVGFHTSQYIPRKAA